MTLHAELSPSAAHRWMRCPGSVRLCAHIPRVDSTYSREGTFAHEIAALCLQENLDPQTQLGRTDGEFTCDSEMVAHIQSYLDVVRGVMLFDGGTLLVEQKVKVSNEIFGTADAIVGARTDLHIFDLKYGAGAYVEVNNNPQLLTYGLGGLLLPVEVLNVTAVTHVHLHIIQPRCSVGDSYWRTSEVTAAYLLDDWQNQLAVAAEATKDEEAPLVPGDHCKFCPAKATCPALRRSALQAAAAVFPTGDVAAPVKPPPPSALTPLEISKVLNAADLVEEWFKSVREWAFNEVRAGRLELPGWKIVERIGNRAWKDEEATAAGLKALGLSSPYESKLVSPATAEKLLAKSLKLSKEKVKTLLEQLAHRPVTGQALAPVDDPRPAINQRSSVFLEN